MAVMSVVMFSATCSSGKSSWRTRHTSYNV